MGGPRTQLTVLIIAGTLTSAIAAAIVHLQITERRQMEITWVCDDHVKALEQGFRDAVGAVEVLADALHNGPALGESGFRRFAASMQARHPGLLGLAWLPTGAGGDAAAAPGVRGERLSEPPDWLSAIKPGSEPAGAPAAASGVSHADGLMRRALHDDALLIGERIGLPTPANGYGTLVAAPVAGPNRPEGVVLGLLGFRDLAKAAIGRLEPRGVDLLLADAEAPASQDVLLFYASRLGSDAVTENAQWKGWASAESERRGKRFELADRRWNVTCSTTPHFRSAEGFGRAPWFLLAGGLTLTLLTAVLVHSLGTQVRERQRIEQALRVSEQRLRAVFSQSPDIMMTVSERGRIIMVNRPWPKAPEESAVGRNSAKILPKGLRKWYRQALAQVFASRSAEQFEYSAADSSRWQVRIVPLRTGSIVDAAMVIATDVTEHRSLEAQAIRSARLATLGVLGASVAHEINNPNNAIQFNAAVVKRCVEDILPLLRRHEAEGGGFLIGGMPAAQAIDGLPRMLAGMLRNSQRIQSIVAHLKGLARHDPGEYAESVELSKVLRASYSLVQHQVARHTDHWAMLLPRSAPLLRGNAPQLEQVFVNLMLNALQALPDRGASVRVDVAVEPGADAVTVAVVDQGCGIADDDLAKILDPFYSTRADQGGTGLGLSICRRIVQNHGGRIEIESVPNVGTEVVVWLPVAGAATSRRVPDGLPAGAHRVEPGAAEPVAPP
jgi:PAS domain S-box-containing protein